MKYRGKKYKWYTITFEEDRPEMVKLYSRPPHGLKPVENSVTTYWDNDLLEDKPL